jgi:gamma-glutamyltranspeptidase/glutathione hydrolase
VKYFTKPDGTRYQAGDTLKNPAYAETVRKMAAEGPSGPARGPDRPGHRRPLHEGDLPSSMTLADLKAYKPRSADALCRPWKVYTVCVPNPQSSSGLAVIQALMMLEHTDIGARGPKDPIAWTLLAQAERVMYADRDRYVGDPSFVKVPVDGLLDPAYVAERAKLIHDNRRPGAGVRLSQGRAQGRGRHDQGTGRHHPLRDQDPAGQRGLDDHHGREHLRLGPDGRRLLPQQPADRLLVLADREGRRARPPTPWPAASVRARRWRR